MNLIHILKREMLVLRKALIPLRDINSSLNRLETHFITKSISPFLKDLYDHTVQVADSFYTYHDMVSNLMELYISLSGNKLNEIMKVLTIFASIFIPLTFIAGWYGMNFKYMPELDFPFSYPIIITVTVGSFIGMLIYFRKKKWIGGKKKKKK
jgi:magnesium transporter